MTKDGAGVRGRGNKSEMGESKGWGWRLEGEGAYMEECEQESWEWKRQGMGRER